MKKAFTIVELLVVIAVIGVLLGIVAVSASDSVKASREKQASALCAIVQSALATYYAQKGEWPEPLKGRIRSGSYGTNNEGPEGESDDDKYVLETEEVRKMVKALVDEAKKGNPLLDISGLVVSRDPGEWKSKGRGMDFMSAIRGTKWSKRKMSTSEMHFGYLSEAGYFRRFKMVYAIPTDHLAVMVQTDPNKLNK